MSAVLVRDMTHAQICKGLDVVPMIPAPNWLPYAARAVKIEIFVDGERIQCWGGGRRCGSCGFGVDMMPGPGSQHPEPEALLRCPKCGFDGSAKGERMDTGK